MSVPHEAHDAASIVPPTAGSRTLANSVEHLPDKLDGAAARSGHDDAEDVEKGPTDAKDDDVVPPPLETLKGATTAEQADEQGTKVATADDGKDPEAGAGTPPVQEDHKIAGHFNAQTNYVPRSQIIIIFLALATVIFTVQLDQTSLAVSSALIGPDLHAGSRTSFITDSYVLTSTSFQLIYGRVSDFFGRKPLIILFLVMFFVGSLGSSLSPDLISLVVFRAFTGIWGGGLVSLGQMVIGDSVSLRDRGKYQGILESFMVLGNGLGPVLGGVLAQKASWRDQYRIMLPLSAISAAVAWRCLPLKKVKGNWKHKAAAVDWVGGVLTLIATTLVVLGLLWAGGSYSWSDAHVLAPLIIGVFFTLLFALWQWKGCSDSRPPLLPLYIFQNRVVCGAAITQGINGWLLYVQMFFIPQSYQLVFGHSPLVAGALLLPLLCVQSLSSTLSGLVVSKTGRYREVLLSGWALWAVGLGLFSTLRETSGWGKQVGFACLTGFGVGQTLQVGLVALQGAVPRKEMAVVTAMRNFVRNLGAAIGLAAGSTIVNTLTVDDLKPLGWTSAQVRAALDNPSALDLSEESLSELRTAYSKGFRANFILLAALAAVAFVATLLLMSHRGIDRDDDAALKAEGKRQVRDDRERRRAKRQRWRGGGAENEKEAAVGNGAADVSEAAKCAARDRPMDTNIRDEAPATAVR